MYMSLLMLSVLWRHILNCHTCVLCTMQTDTVYPSARCTVHTHNSSKYAATTDNINNDMYIGTRHVILAKHQMWLPDDGFIWTETCWSSFHNFNYFNNLRILQFVCISWTIKCLILLMHGATMKFTEYICLCARITWSHHSRTCSHSNSHHIWNTPGI